jgi:hypothetical protein
LTGGRLGFAVLFADLDMISVVNMEKTFYQFTRSFDTIKRFFLPLRSQTPPAKRRVVSRAKVYKFGF